MDDVASTGTPCGPYYKYHNEWDLAGVMFYQDAACSVPMGAAGAQLSSESTHHEWHHLPATRPGWGFMESAGGAFINERQSGGSRLTIQLTGGIVPRCIAIGTCAPSKAEMEAAAKAGGFLRTSTRPTLNLLLLLRTSV